MRLAPRSPLAALVLLLLVVTGAALGGCSSRTDAGDSGPTVTATGPDEPTSPPASASTAPAEPSEALAAVCAPYAVMVRAIERAASTGAAPDQVAAEIGPVMQEFAARVPTLDRPPGLDAEVWEGIGALASRILALPDRPTFAEIEAVERDLSADERAAVGAAAAWFRGNCPV